MTVVVKLGGSIINNYLDKILLDVRENIRKQRIVLVHGGGKQVTDVAEKMNVKQRFVVSPSGFRSRYTDEKTIEIYQMVIAGLINKKIVSRLQSLGVNAVGISGIDGSLLLAKRKKKIKVVEGKKTLLVDGGYTGKIVKVNIKLLETLLKEGFTPVISALAIGEEFLPLNVDGDRAAAYIAGSIGADKLLFLTDVGGIILDGKLLQHIKDHEARELMGKAGFGMRKKIFASLEALSQGVEKVLISSGCISNPISTALNEKNCTVITC